MRVSCLECGAPFEAKTRAARFCGVNCRQRSSRRDREQAGTAEPTPISAARPDPPLVAQTRRELDQAGVVDSVQGQAALLLAERLAAGRDTGSAMASLARQLSAAMAEALAGGTKQADSLDELAAWREKKASGA